MEYRTVESATKALALYMQSVEWEHTTRKSLHVIWAIVWPGCQRGLIIHLYNPYNKTFMLLKGSEQLAHRVATAKSSGASPLPASLRVSNAADLLSHLTGLRAPVQSAFLRPPVSEDARLGRKVALTNLCVPSEKGIVS